MGTVPRSGFRWERSLRESWQEGRDSRVVRGGWRHVNSLILFNGFEGVERSVDNGNQVFFHFQCKSYIVQEVNEIVNDLVTILYLLFPTHFPHILFACSTSCLLFLVYILISFYRLSFLSCTALLFMCSLMHCMITHAQSCTVLHSLLTNV